MAMRPSKQGMLSICVQRGEVPHSPDQASWLSMANTAMGKLSSLSAEQFRHIFTRDNYLETTPRASKSAMNAIVVDSSQSHVAVTATVFDGSSVSISSRSAQTGAGLMLSHIFTPTEQQIENQTKKSAQNCE